MSTVMNLLGSKNAGNFLTVVVAVISICTLLLLSGYTII